MDHNIANLSVINSVRNIQAKSEAWKNVSPAPNQCCTQR